MQKQTYWFPHDFEPTADPKIQAMIGNFGGLGYGVFWRIIEMLHSSADRKLPLKNYLFEAIAKQMQANAKQISDLLNYCINECELLQSDGAYFWSDRVNRNFDKRLEISKIRSEAGRKGGKSKQLLSKTKQKKRNNSITINSNTYNERAQKYIDFVNRELKKNFRLTEKVVGHFRARIENSKYTAEELATVVKNVKQSTYHIETNFGYATAEFLLRESTIEKYKGGPIIQKPTLIPRINDPEPPKGQKYDPATDIYGT